MVNGKEIWEEIAEREAYFGVATFDKYLAGGLDEEAKREFFESGREHVDLVFSELENAFGPLGRPAKALDYGCGVGRVLSPLAERCESVVGVDISSGMLDECRKNLDAAGVESSELQTAEQFLAGEECEFELVHSYIVLQHVEPNIGYQIIEKMLTSLKPGGVGMIHVTHADVAPLFRRLRSRVYRDIPFAHRALSLVKREKRPFIPMYSYDMGRVAMLLDRSGCSNKRSILTDHGYSGEMIFFIKDTTMTETSLAVGERL